MHPTSLKLVKYKTKGQLFSERTNWQSARSAIRKDAVLVVRDNNIEKKCKICDYSNHVEICHIKSVSSFSDSTLISEINSVDNLLILCPNHHWEFDNGLITI